MSPMLGDITICNHATHTFTYDKSTLFFFSKDKIGCIEFYF